MIYVLFSSLERLLCFNLWRNAILNGQVMKSYKNAILNGVKLLLQSYCIFYKFQENLFTIQSCSFFYLNNLNMLLFSCSTQIWVRICPKRMAAASQKSSGSYNWKLKFNCFCHLHNLLDPIVDASYSFIQEYW